MKPTSSPQRFWMDIGVPCSNVLHKHRCYLPSLLGCQLVCRSELDSFPLKDRGLGSTPSTSEMVVWGDREPWVWPVPHLYLDCAQVFNGQGGNYCGSQAVSRSDRVEFNDLTWFWKIKVLSYFYFSVLIVLMWLWLIKAWVQISLPIIQWGPQFTNIAPPLVWLMEGLKEGCRRFSLAWVPSPPSIYGLVFSAIKWGTWFFPSLWYFPSVSNRAFFFFRSIFLPTAYEPSSTPKLLFNPFPVPLASDLTLELIQPPHPARSSNGGADCSNLGPGANISESFFLFYALITVQRGCAFPPLPLAGLQSKAS